MTFLQKEVIIFELESLSGNSYLQRRLYVF